MPVYPIGENNNALVPLTFPLSDIIDTDIIKFSKDNIEYKNTMAKLKAYVLGQTQEAFSNGDPYASDVILHLKGDGVDGSTNIIDSSPNPKTVSVFGNTRISTAQSKYGGSSILFNGTTDYLSVPATGDMLFTTQNFTWEAMIFPTNLSAAYRMTLMGNARASSGGDYGMYLQAKKNATNQTMFSAWSNENGAIGAELILNQWAHIACTRSGTNVEIFIRGIKGIAGTCASTISSHSQFMIGTVFENSGYANNYAGYIDNIRLTKGIRYTTNFNPETDTFLN